MYASTDNENFTQTCKVVVEKKLPNLQLVSAFWLQPRSYLETVNTPISESEQNKVTSVANLIFMILFSTAMSINYYILRN